MSVCAHVCVCPSQEYKKIQSQYLAYVETYDPDNISQLLAHHPFHIDSLLQLAYVSQCMGEGGSVYG